MKQFTHLKKIYYMMKKITLKSHYSEQYATKKPHLQNSMIVMKRYGKIQFRFGCFHWGKILFPLIKGKRHLWYDIKKKGICCQNVTPRKPHHVAYATSSIHRYFRKTETKQMTTKLNIFFIKIHFCCLHVGSVVLHTFCSFFFYCSLARYEMICSIFPNTHI